MDPATIQAQLATLQQSIATVARALPVDAAPSADGTNNLLSLLGAPGSATNGAGDGQHDAFASPAVVRLPFSDQNTNHQQQQQQQQHQHNGGHQGSSAGLQQMPADLRVYVTHLEGRLSSTESRLHQLAAEYDAFRRDTKSTLDHLTARVISFELPQGMHHQQQQQQPQPHHANGAFQMRQSPGLPTSLSPGPLASALGGTSSPSGIPSFHSTHTGGSHSIPTSLATNSSLPGNAVVMLEHAKLPMPPVQSTSASVVSPQQGGEHEPKKRKRKTDEENKLRELIRLEINNAIDWDLEHTGPGSKPVRKAPQPDKIPHPGLWVPNFTQTIKQSSHNTRFMEYILARLQSDQTMRDNPSLRTLLLDTDNLRNILETRFSTVKGDYAAQNSEAKAKARVEKTYKGKQARRGDRKAVKRLQQLIKHEAQLEAEGFPASMRQGFDAPALHSDEESEEENTENGGSIKYCRPVPIPFRSQRVLDLIHRADELIESERAAGDKASPRYTRRTRREYQGDLASAPRPPKNKLYHWQINPNYLSAVYQAGCTDSELGLLPDPHNYMDTGSHRSSFDHADPTSGAGHAHDQGYPNFDLDVVDPHLS